MKSGSLSGSVVISSTDPKTKRIDLAASAARVISARRLAAEQTRVVEAAGSGADRRAIDLMLLLQESVLVFDETHAMLKALASQAETLDRGNDARPVGRDDRRGTWHRPLVLAAKVVALVIASAFFLELVDPAPMDVLAFLKPAPSPARSGQP